jgi:hypothetical protein
MGFGTIHRGVDLLCGIDSVGPGGDKQILTKLLQFLAYMIM